MQLWWGWFTRRGLRSTPIELAFRVVYWNKFMLKFVFVDKFFLTWLLVCCQPIWSHAWNFGLTNMDFKNITWQFLVIIHICARSHTHTHTYFCAVVVYITCNTPEKYISLVYHARYTEHIACTTAINNLCAVAMQVALYKRKTSFDLWW